MQPGSSRLYGNQQITAARAVLVSQQLARACTTPSAQIYVSTPMVFDDPRRTIERWQGAPTPRGLSRGEEIMTKPTNMVLAAGAAFAAAVIGLAPAARADEPDPFQLLFGDTGLNTWTPTADAYLDTNDPTLAAGFESSVDVFHQGGSFLFPNDPFTFVTDELDSTAFSGGFPDNAIGDFAVGLDYSVDAVGLYPTIDPYLDVLFGVGV
jgi:hypothetical protein